MVTRSNRPQVNFSPRGPGLAVQRAQAVPFIPATRRTGVGDNFKQGASALQKLAGAVGVFSAKAEAHRERDRHAENKRHERYLHQRSNDTPEQRKEIQKKYGLHPVADGFKQITDVKRHEVPKLRKQLDDQFKRWASVGWQTPDEDGNMRAVTEDDIKAYYTEVRQLNVYDRFGDGLGEKGRLHDPQVTELNRELKRHHGSLMRSFDKYKSGALHQEALETVEQNSTKTLADAYYVEGLRGDALLKKFIGFGNEAYSVHTGFKTIPPEYRNPIFKRQLQGLLRRISTREDVDVLTELLEAKLPGSGAKVRDTYRSVVAPLERAAKRIMKGVQYEEAYARFGTEALENARKNSNYDIKPRKVEFKDGTSRTVSAKEIENYVKAEIKRKALVAAGSEREPLRKPIEWKRTLQAYRGSPYLDDEIKNKFSSASWGVARENPEELGEILTLSRDLKDTDPLKFRKYVKDPRVRAELRNVERLLEVNPALGPEGAMNLVKQASDENGNIPPWKAMPPVLAKEWRDYKKSSDFREDNFGPEEMEELSTTVRIRFASPDARKAMDTDGDGELSKKEFAAVVEEERENIKKGFIEVNGSVVRPRPGQTGEAAEAEVKAALKQIGKQSNTRPEDMRLQSIPGNKGYYILDKNGDRVTYTYAGREYEATVTNEHLKAWAEQNAQGKVRAATRRAGGADALAGTEKENQEKINNARKNEQDVRTWWDMFTGRNAPSTTSELKKPPQMVPHPKTGSAHPFNQ